MVARLKALAAKALAALKAAWQKEPVRVRAIIASVIVFALAKFGIVVPEADVIQALALILPILLGGELARSRVNPVGPGSG